MCKHNYILVRTKTIRIGTSFCKRQVTTDYYECKNCKKTTFVKRKY